MFALFILLVYKILIVHRKLDVYLKAVKHRLDWIRCCCTIWRRRMVWCLPACKSTPAPNVQTRTLIHNPHIRTSIPPCPFAYATSIQVKTTQLNRLLYMENQRQTEHWLCIESYFPSIVKIFMATKCSVWYLFWIGSRVSSLKKGALIVLASAS